MTNSSITQYCSAFLLCAILLIVPEFTFAQAPVPIKKGKKYGYQLNGNWIIKAKFSHARVFSDGMAAVEKKGKWGFVNLKGEIVVKIVYPKVRDFHNGVAAIYSGNLSRWGYINQAGKHLIRAEYRHVTDFEHQFGFATKNDPSAKWCKYEMIDQEGKVLRKRIQSWEAIGNEETKLKVIGVSKRPHPDTLYMAVNAKGETIAPLLKHDFDLRKGDFFAERIAYPYYAYIDGNGKTLTDWYPHLKKIEQGRIIFGTSAKKYGALDENYDLLIPAHFDRLRFSGNALIAKKGRYSLVVDVNGKPLSGRYVNYLDFEEGSAIAWQEDRKHCLIAENGEIIAGPYKKIRPFSEGFARINFRKDYKDYYAYIDPSGKLISEEFEKSWEHFSPESTGSGRSRGGFVGALLRVFTGAFLITDVFFRNKFHPSSSGTYSADRRRFDFMGGDFSNGRALVAQNAGNITKKVEGGELTSTQARYGYIDSTGKIVIACQYSHADNFREGIATIGKAGKFGAIGRDGEEILEIKYAGIGFFAEGLCPVSRDTVWKFVDSSGKQVIGETFQDAQSFSQGLAAVQRGEKWGYINSKGEVIIDFQYENAAPFRFNSANVWIHDRKTRIKLPEW